MAAAVAEPIIVRRIPLECPDDLDWMLVEGSPEASHAIVWLSLLLPDVEPYLIRSMRAAADHLAAPKLLADIDAFNAQEGRSGQLLWRAVTGLYPKVLATYLPWYTPHAIDMPAAAKALADRYSARSRTSYGARPC